jgi:hypothetical protein
MTKLSAAEAQVLSGLMPGNQNVGLGERLKEHDESCSFQITTDIAAGAVGIVTPANLPADPFDFEILDVTIRTNTAVTSSAVQIKNNTTAISDVIISAAAKVITRVAQVDPAYNKFYPKSNPTAYAAAKCNIVDSGGATAAARTVTLWVRKL